MRKKLALLLAVGLLVSSCTSIPVYMKNPKTGEIVNCGGQETNPTGAIRERGCIDDYKDQGWERVPHK